MFGVPLPPWFSVRPARRPSTHGLITGPVGEPHRLHAEVLPSSFGAQRLVGHGLRTLWSASHPICIAFAAFVYRCVSRR
ncbi:hypothetical protein D4768_21295 [Rhodococcus erythropolis]|nr:hypothetical protein D4768_21295 [Rhodococcus erythropolis]